MNEVATIKPDNRRDHLAMPAPTVVSSTADAMARLSEWVTAASQASQLVAPLVGSAFVPDGYKPRIERGDTDEQIQEKRETALANATAAVLLGLSIGVDPLTALQQIIIIKGRPGMYAKFKVALLQSRGFDIWTDEISDESVTVKGSKPGDGRIHEATVTMDQAKRAGWTSNDAYAKTPSDMLWARAAGRLCDRIGGNVLMGIPTAEDNHDEPVRVDAQVGRVTADIILAGSEPQSPPPKRTRRTASSAKRDADITTRPADLGPATEAPSSAPGPAAAGALQDPPAAPAGDPPTPEAMKAMFAALKRANITEKDTALAFIADVIGREVQSRAHLNARDVADVLAALEVINDVDERIAAHNAAEGDAADAADEAQQRAEAGEA